MMIYRMPIKGRHKQLKNSIGEALRKDLSVNIASVDIDSNFILMELGNRRRHRLITALEQVNRMIGKEPKTVSVNLGFHREYPDWCHPSADLQTIQ